MVVLKCLQLYSAFLSRVWVLLPRRLSSWLVTAAVFGFGITARGEWALVIVHVLQHFGGLKSGALNSSKELFGENISLKSLHLEGLPSLWLLSVSVSFFIYILLGGFLHWHYYVKQRDRPEEWKCQPTKWLTPELERHSILYGCQGLLSTSTMSSLMYCYIFNGGRNTLYLKFDEYSWLWYFAQWPVLFIYEDYTAYLVHRLYHTPWLYRHFHKAHHRYVQPTPFTVTAIHPMEIVSMQMVMFVPIFTFPVHWTSFTAIILYIYYYGIIDHSGIDFKAPWWQPWRPDTIFHDNHHQYFHVNFGFNSFYWDILHGTHRKTDRIYKENIFYGKGKPISEASKDELEEERKERLAENLKAHRHLSPLLNGAMEFESKKKQ